jgi:hypothetical protein
MHRVLKILMTKQKMYSIVFKLDKETCFFIVIYLFNDEVIKEWNINKNEYWKKMIYFLL